MFGPGYSVSFLARSLYDVYLLFPDETFAELLRKPEVWEGRMAAAEALSKSLVGSSMPEKVLKSMEANVSNVFVLSEYSSQLLDR